jgi:hypothetical protein
MMQAAPFCVILMRAPTSVILMRAQRAEDPLFRPLELDVFGTRTGRTEPGQVRIKPEPLL